MDLLTREEAAQHLRISTDTLDRLRKAGKIAYIQHVKGGKVWFTEDALRDYIARTTHTEKPQKEVKWTYRRRRR